MILATLVKGGLYEGIDNNDNVDDLTLCNKKKDLIERCDYNHMRRGVEKYCLKEIKAADDECNKPKYRIMNNFAKTQPFDLVNEVYPELKKGEICNAYWEYAHCENNLRCTGIKKPPNIQWNKKYVDQASGKCVYK